jgi:Lactonase, 7-bladed beta-propeller
LVGNGPGDLMVFSVRRNAKYVVSMSFNSGEAVSHRMERDGSLTEVSRTPTGPEPRAIAMARDGDYAVVVNSISNQVVVMSVGEDGVLSEVDRIDSGGLNPYDVDAAYNDVVVVANRDSNEIRTFHIDRRGQLTAVDSTPTGNLPHVVSVSRGRDGLIAVANQGDRSVSMYQVDRRGQLTPGGTIPLDNMTPRTLSWQGRNLFVALDAPSPNEDLIRAFHVRRNGEIVQDEDTPAGAFLTDIEVIADMLFAVTVNRNNLADPTDDRDEVIAFRRDGTSLTREAAVQTPGVPPSFKQITAARGRRGNIHILTTEFQGGWLRSFLWSDNDEDQE